jgi:hypothetical protein
MFGRANTERARLETPMLGPGPSSPDRFNAVLLLVDVVSDLDSQIMKLCSASLCAFQRSGPEVLDLVTLSRTALSTPPESTATPLR